MPYTNDMQTLANIVGTGAAAQQAGIQDSQANEAEALKNQLSANQLPAESEKPALANLFTQAQTQTQQGIGKQQNAAGDVAQALVPGDIALGQAKNETGTSAQKVQQYQQVGQVMNQAATFMDQVPEAARPAAMQALTQKLGVDPSSLGNLMNGNPDDLRKAATGIIQGTSDYVTKMNEQSLRNQGSTDVAGIGANARMTAAEASANARVQAANVMAQMRQQQQTAEQAMVQAQKRGDANSYKMYAQMALQLKQAQAGITSALVTGQPLSVPDMAQPGGGGNSTPAPAQPANSAPPGNALADEMRRRGLLK